MSGVEKCWSCGGTIKEGAKFCGQCGKPVSGRISCPHCGEEVSAARYCGKCGGKLGTAAATSATSADWDRGADVFAMKLSEKKVRDAESGFEVRHGSKALFFENGRLVDIADSRRYTRGDSFLRNLFAKKKRLSAVLVDAGDVVLPFSVSEMMTSDSIAVGVDLNVVVRLDDHNSFYINVMKDRETFTLRDLRAMLFPEVKNSVAEAVAEFSYAGLTPSREAKEKVASRLARHLRDTFGRMGFEFGQVRAIEFQQTTLDGTRKKMSASETTARDIEGEVRGRFRVERAKQDAGDLERELEKGALDGKRADQSIRQEEIEVELDSRQIEGQGELAAQGLENEHELAGLRQKKKHVLTVQDEQQDYVRQKQRRDNAHNLDKHEEDNRYNLSREQQDAEFITRRIEVYQKLKDADTSKIKTDEDFRKFRQEVDRDRVLDDHEWQELKDELLWKKEDRRRDRSFLVRKIEIEQRCDLKKLDILNSSDLTILMKEQKFRHAELDREERKRELKNDREMSFKKQEFDEQLEVQKARHEATVAEIKEIEAKNLEVQKRLKDLEKQKAGFEQAMQQDQAGFEQKLAQDKAKFGQELEQEQDKALVGNEVDKLNLEIVQLKSDMGMNNMERMKAIKRRDQQERELHQLTLEQERFVLEEKRAARQFDEESRRTELRIREEIEKSRMRQEEIKVQGTVETERLAAMGNLNVEQLIAVSGMDQAKVLGELGKTREMRGMSAEEIMAMNDPAALGRALEERAKGAATDELKGLYERMLAEKESSGQQVSQAYKDTADRAERMADKGAERMERMFSRSTSAMQGMQGNIMAGERRAASELAAAERHAADRTERMAHDSLNQMGGVATTRATAAPGGSHAGGAATDDRDQTRVVICANCKQEVKSTENFCPNCGNKMY